MPLSTQACSALLARRRRQIGVALRADAFAEYRRLLEAPGFTYDEERSSWLAARYADVRAILLDPETFSSQRTLNADGSVDELASGGIIGLDPPRHRQLRSLLAKAFTQQRIAALEPRILEITDHLLDGMPGKGTADLVDALAFPLPVTVIGELLGVPLEDIGRFRELSAALLGNDMTRRARAFGSFAEYFEELVVQREGAPTDDLISAFVGAEVAGARLERREITSACTLLLVAGHETTTSLITNVLWCLDEYRDARREIADNPALLPGAIEETLRLRSVVHYMPRVVTRDITWQGQPWREGDLVLPLLAAANLDPREFEDPERFDIRRSPNRHLGFGMGIHLCLGATLARLETKIAVGRLLERFPDVTSGNGHQIRLRPSPIVYALEQYPIQTGNPDACGSASAAEALWQTG